MVDHAEHPEPKPTATPALTGVTLARWLQLLAQNRFSIDPPYYGRAARTTVVAVMNSLVAASIGKTSRAAGTAAVPPPLFVIGHWRSGTTLLHEYLCAEGRFAWPTLLDAWNPNTFLALGATARSRLARRLPKTRGLDEIAVSADSPAECDLALWHAGEPTSYLAWTFPRNAARWEACMSFRHALRSDLVRWRLVYSRWVERLSQRAGRPLVLKSPQHTARVRLLAELFPGARFIHIHRDPYAVFASTLRLVRHLAQLHNLQRAAALDSASVLRRGAEMFAALREDEPHLPPNHLVHVAYADLVADPVGQLRRAFDALGFEWRPAAESALRAHAARVASVQARREPLLDVAARRDVRRHWAWVFDRWGYES